MASDLVFCSFWYSCCRVLVIAKIFVKKYPAIFLHNTHFYISTRAEEDNTHREKWKVSIMYTFSQLLFRKNLGNDNRRKWR